MNLSEVSTFGSISFCSTVAHSTRAIGRTSYEYGIAEVEQSVHEVAAGEPEQALERLARVAEGADVLTFLSWQLGGPEP